MEALAIILNFLILLLLVAASVGLFRPSLVKQKSRIMAFLVNFGLALVLLNIKGVIIPKEEPIEKGNTTPHYTVPQSSSGLGQAEDTNSANIAETPRKPLDVKITLDVKVTELPDRRVRIYGTTNLPTGTHLVLSVEESVQDGFFSQSKCSVLADGLFSEQFGPYDGLKRGLYVAGVLMIIPRGQPDPVKRIIGENGENLAGPLVEKGTYFVMVTTKKEFTISGAQAPRYEIVDRDTYDTPIKTQIRLYAVVSGTITELYLKKLLQKLYYKANATRGFKFHGGKPTHVFILLYTSRDHFKSGMGQWIAMLSKIGKGSRIDTEIKTELIAQFEAKPEFKHGLPESKRKEVFKAIVKAEDRTYSDVLREKYKSEVAEQYGITQEQLRDISVEGLMKNWPMPPMP